ncbi:MAG: AAA-like domain-containing protein [Leptolyngbyaceae cyanobacterium]
MIDYQVGGSLPVDAPSYIERSADHQLYTALSDRQFCYVLTSRQMGKSSLRLRMRHRLEAAGQGRCVAIDLTRIGSYQLTQGEWYQGLAFDLVRKLGLQRQLAIPAWWQRLGNLSAVQKFGQLLESVLDMDDTCAPLYIFLDEIDSVRGLSFSVDDFFGLVRFCYNERAENPRFRRLTWGLFGVATPRDLVQNPQQTPFNIGRAVSLTGFSETEAAPLTAGLVAIAQRPEALLREVLYWTGGQPFLTQKVCALLREGYDLPLIAAGREAAWVAAVVRSRLIHNWEVQDDPEHLRTIRDRLTQDNRRAGRLLSLYQRVLAQRQLQADGSQDQAELKLSGIVVEQAGQLQVTNPVYAAVFNPEWIDDHLSQQRPYAAALNAWIASSYQDESRLLMGQALAEAVHWSTDKSLSDLDYRFLSASQEWDAKMIRLELEAQAKANQMLAEAQQKAARVIGLGYASLGACLVISAIALITSLLR